MPTATAPSCRIEREEIIEAIVEINHGVSRAWLEAFETEHLREYLEHLDLVIRPRGTTWVRPAGTPPAYERRAA